MFSLKKLIPTECFLCKVVSDHEIPNLCNSCEYKLPYLQDYCAQCALPLAVSKIGTAYRCGRCLRYEPSFDESYCAIKYEEPISSLVARAKYNRELTCLSSLSSIFFKGYYKYKHDKHHVTPDVIIPIPLSCSRQMARGFNQSQGLAELVSKKLGIPVENQVLKRIRHTRPQQGLSRSERLKNLKDSFAVLTNIAGLNIALFDDVITTGATMESAASVLKKSGAKYVVAWSIARTA